MTCNKNNNNGKVPDFIKSTYLKSPTSDSGTRSLPPIGKAFLYIETSSGNHANGVFVSFEQTDILQTSKVTL